MGEFSLFVALTEKILCASDSKLKLLLIIRIKNSRNFKALWNVYLSPRTSPSWRSVINDHFWLRQHIKNS